VCLAVWRRALWITAIRCLTRAAMNITLLCMVTSDKGLCGAFNTNLNKAAQQFLREHADKRVELVPVGRKGRDFFRRRPVSKLREYINITARTVQHTDAAEIAGDLMGMYTAEDSTIDKVFLIYTEFKSVLSQNVTVKQLLPIPTEVFGGEGPARGEPSANRVDYLYEQPPAEIFASLLPRYIETQVFYALLESVASEQGARMTAMDSASKNAGEVIDTLTLNMNRVRQASITPRNHRSRFGRASPERLTRLKAEQKRQKWRNE